MPTHFVNIEVTSTAGTRFTNSAQGDVTIYAEDSNQIIHIGTDITKSSTLAITNSNVQITGDFVPTADEMYDLGSSNMKFRDLFLSGNTLHLGGAKITTNLNNDIEIRNQDDTLKKLVVDEIHIGSSATPLILRATEAGALDVSNSSGEATNTTTNELTASNITASNIEFTGTLTRNGQPFQSGTPGLSNTATAVYVLAGSNLGVGTSTPQEKLDVVGNANVSGGLTVGGNFTVSGTTTTINTQTLLIEDNIVVLNKSQTGTPPSILKSGIEVERGDLTNYQFVFEEATDLFKVGVSNDLQAVATRDDNLASGYAYYNASLSKLQNKDLATSDIVSGTLAVARGGTGVTTSTGTGNVVLSASPTLTGTVIASNIDFSGTLTRNGVPFESGETLSIDEQTTYTIDVTKQLSIVKTQPFWGLISIKGPDNCEVRDIKVDKDNNIYLSGFYSGTAPTIYNASGAASSVTMKTSDGGTVGFVVKFNPKGEAVWASFIDGVGDQYPTRTFIDQSGNVYIGGVNSSTTTIYNSDKQASSTVTITNTNGIFTVKYNRNGIAIWAISTSTSGWNYLNDLCVDSAENVYLVGSFGNPWPSWSYGHSVLSANNVAWSSWSTSGTNSNGMFLLKYNKDGVGQLNINYPGGADFSSAFGNACALSPAEDFIYVACDGYSITNFGNSVTISSSSGGSQAVIVKFKTSDGLAEWAAKVDSTTADYAQQVAVDNDGNVYLTGYYFNDGGTPTVYSANNVNIAINVNLLQANSFKAGMLVKYTSSGVAQWGSTIDANVNMTHVAFSQISKNLSLWGEYFASGPIINSGQINSGVTLRAPTGKGMFFIEISQNGAYQASSTVDSSVDDQAARIATNSNGKSYIAFFNTTTSATNVYNSSNSIVYTIPAQVSSVTRSYVLLQDTLPSFQTPVLTVASNGLKKILTTDDKVQGLWFGTPSYVRFHDFRSTNPLRIVWHQDKWLQW